MSAEMIVERLRRFLLMLAGFICVGTIGELTLIKHIGDPVQWIPFVLCGLGIVVVALALIRPQRLILRTLQGVMGLLIAGSLFGVYEHIKNNLGFALETQPHATTGTLILKALGGANPLLAPGMLAFAAILAMAATYYHPALKPSQLAKA